MLSLFASFAQYSSSEVHVGNKIGGEGPKFLIILTWVSEYFVHLPVIPEPEDLGNEGEGQQGEAVDEALGALLQDQEDGPDQEGGQNGEPNVDGADNSGNFPVVWVFKSSFVFKTIVCTFLDHGNRFNAFLLVKAHLACFDGLVKLFIELVVTLDVVCVKIAI